MSNQVPINIMCTTGSQICRQKISHFFKFQVDNTASCVWCHQSFLETLNQDFYSQNTMDN